MHPMEALAGQMRWAGEDTAYNLGFIPEDRLSWQPAPTAKSALDIVNHAAFFIRAMTPVLAGAAWSEPEFSPATNLEQAQELIAGSAREYATALGALTPQALGRTVELPFGTFPLGRAAAMPVIDLIHHRGQIAYLQTLLGDQENHFRAVDGL